MRIDTCYEETRKLMIEHGIGNWGLKFDDSIRRFGCCNYSTQKISLSAKLVDLNDWETVKNVVLHEIAHALMPKCHHNWKWKMKLIEIGGDGKRCYGNEVVLPKARYKADCPACGHTHYKNAIRRGINQSCGACGDRRYDETKKLIWKINN